MSVAVAAAETRMPLALSAIEPRTVVAAQAGDVEARDALARSCQQAAFRFALHLTGNWDDALELSQDAMVRFFGSLGRFDAGRPVRPWLLRIVRNLVRDRARRLRVRKVEPLESDDGSTIVDPMDPGPNPEERADTAERQRRLWAAVVTLAPKHREVIALRDYLDLSYDEIAEVLKVPRGTVMSRLHRARIRLKNTLRGQLRKGVVQ